jgi:hypothetical protein
LRRSPYRSRRGQPVQDRGATLRRPYQRSSATGLDKAPVVDWLATNYVTHRLTAAPQCTVGGEASRHDTDAEVHAFTGSAGPDGTSAQSQPVTPCDRWKMNQPAGVVHHIPGTLWFARDQTHPAKYAAPQSPPSMRHTQGSRSTPHCRAPVTTRIATLATLATRATQTDRGSDIRRRWSANRICRTPPVDRSNGGTWRRRRSTARLKCGLAVKSGPQKVPTARHLESVRTDVWVDSSPGDREGSHGRGNELR